MAEIHPPRPAKPFVALLAVDSSLLGVAEEKLQTRFGAIDLRSGDFPFRYTDYYSREMGKNLVRRFISFAELVDPSDLAEAKCFTSQLEEEFRTQEGKRRINLDPGYLNESKIVLASTKDNAHRIVIGKGIYAEITLLYESKAKTYNPLQWTYPDYASGDYMEFFHGMRTRFRQQTGHN